MTTTLSILSLAPGALRLSSGRLCTLASPSIPGLRGYHVLALPGEPPGPDDEAELFLCARGVARALASARHGDPDCYSLMYSAARTRRRPWPHVHIVIASSVATRRRAVLLLQLKHLFRWRRWFGARRPTPRPGLDVQSRAI